MKLPSIQKLMNDVIGTAKRFPTSLILSAIATICYFILIEKKFDNKKISIHFISSIIMACSVFMPFSIALYLWMESILVSKFQKFLGAILPLGLASIYVFMFPSENEPHPNQIYIRYALLLIGAHLLVSFFPFIKSKNINSFWQYNKTLFIRILTAMLYSGVLCFGLLMAMMAVEHLLKVDISENRYMELPTFIFGIFNTWFFLAGLPSPLSKLENEQQYPNGLKVFTQYILLPLVGLYFGILYIYIGKGIFTQQLINGWSVYLVLCFSIVGVLSLLLIYPISNNSDNKWMQFVSKWFYILLIPILALLYYSIKTRIDQYGLTADRYCVCALALWLSFVTIYNIFSSRKNILIIPISLFIVTLFACYAPIVNALELSKIYQLKKLETLLIKYKCLQNGKIIKCNIPVLQKDYNQINSSVEYLSSTNGFSAFENLVSKNVIDDFKKTNDEHYDSRTASTILSLIGINNSDSWTVNNNVITDTTSAIFINPIKTIVKQFDLQTNNKVNLIEVKGYDVVIDLSMYDDKSMTNELAYNSNKIRVTCNPSKRNIEILLNQKSLGFIEIKNQINELNKNHELLSAPVTQAELTFYNTTKSIKLNLKSLSIIDSSGELKIKSLSGNILLKDIELVDNHQ